MYFCDVDNKIIKKSEYAIIITASTTYLHEGGCITFSEWNQYVTMNKAQNWIKHLQSMSTSIVYSHNVLFL